MNTQTAEPASASALKDAPLAIDSQLTMRVKGYALRELGADLVGIANIARFGKAPLKMSPQGIMPSARSVIVMAVHHPDAAIEMGGRQHPQEIGPYRVQYWMNAVLDEMSYRMALHLERGGHAAVPIVSSNIWRYKGYKELTEHFAPDLSHLHAAVAAGLSEFGYSGLSITPEFGARQRYVTVITDAALESTPLLDPGTVCDGCNLCVKHCLSGALSKEIDGENVVEIEDKRYTYARKNLWRCAWGEHFDLDLDLPIPDLVDEDVIIEMVRKHGFRSGEMGSCLRYCLPKKLRYFDPDYTNAPRRRRRRPAPGPDRPLIERVRALAMRRGIDFVVMSGAARLEEMGVDIAQQLPDGAAALTLGLHFRTPESPDATRQARRYVLEAAAYDVARELERHGHSALSCTGFPEETLQARLTSILPGRTVETATVLTSAPLGATSLELPAPEPGPVSPDALADDLKRLAAALGADLVGVAPAERLAALRPQLADILGGEKILVARDRSSRFHEYDPEINEVEAKALTPDDHLRGARSVLVMGLRLPAETVRRTARPPAEAIGPYAFAQYESVNLLRLMGLRASRLLEDRGFRAALTFDLCGTGSSVGNPRGEQPDAFSNRFAAVAAGLGRLGRGGFVLTDEFGPNLRFVAVVTDAELTPDELAPDACAQACKGCSRCIDACSTGAFSREVTVDMDGISESFRLLDRNRCDWAKRYSLVASEGVGFLGWQMDVPVPDEIDADALAGGLRAHPVIEKYRPCNFEACALACPLARSD